MDLKKIFLKDACPTKMGGQAVLDGIMMRGEDRNAVVIRLPDGNMHIKTEKLKKPGKWSKLPLIRGVVAFISSLVLGTGVLMYSAEVLGEYEMEHGEEVEEPGRFEKWLTDKFGEKGAWNFMLYSSVVFAVAITILVFILMPTWLMDLLGKVTDNAILLNLAEGVFRILLFILYIIAISRMNDIRKTFQYHGAEHKTIHCFENGKELTPENCQEFYTLHPRCGTSFLMFVLVIALILFSFLGWPNLALRITSRLLLIPVIAGLSYELLKWAGRSDNWLVKILSMPGLYLQKLTTREPDNDQLEVAIAAVKAVMVDKDAPCIEGLCDKEGRLTVKEEDIKKAAEPDDTDKEPEEPEPEDIDKTGDTK